jgi:hypothetical protein
MALLQISEPGEATAPRQFVYPMKMGAVCCHR